jgi:hypothetical protein
MFVLGLMTDLKLKERRVVPDINIVACYQKPEAGRKAKKTRNFREILVKMIRMERDEEVRCV